MEFRVEQLVLRRGVTAQEAQRLIRKSDADRKSFIKKYFHHDVTDPHAHDLVVNINQVAPEFAVQLIFDAVQFWLKRSGLQARKHNTLR